MRASPVDQILLDIFFKEHAHLISLQVYEEIRERLPAVNPSTVYRSLERLVEFGKVSVSDMGTGSAIYELLADGLHHHLVCQKCGQVTTLSHGQVGRFFKEIEQESQFRVLTNHLILFGICEKCGKSGENEA